MRFARSLIAYLGFAGLASAVPKDPALTDESYIRQQSELSQARSREIVRTREAKRREFLDLSRVGGEEDSCLAYSRETGGCAISAQEFDRGLESHFPDSLEFRSAEGLAILGRKARRAVFDGLLERAFLEARRREDSLRPAAPEAGRAGTEGRVGYAGSGLPALLKAFPGIRAQVFAASDSGWLEDRLDDPNSGILPVTLPAWELPDSAAALLARCGRGEWTPVRRVPFGFLACAWLDTLPAPGDLAVIRARAEKPPRGTDALLRARAIDSLRKPGWRCQEEDTLELSLRVSPPFRRSAREPGPAWLGAHSAVLPPALKSRLWAEFAHGRMDTLGPVRSGCGTWMLALSSREIRRGRPLDPGACLARAEAELRKKDDADRLRSEWERLATKRGADGSADARTALLERYSRPGVQPESSYQAMRDAWVSRSLRFGRDLGFLDESPGTGVPGASARDGD